MKANEPLVNYDPVDVPKTLDLLKGGCGCNMAIQYLELLNEPDIPLGGRPMSSPEDSAKIVKPLLDYNKEHKITTLLSPALSQPHNLFDANGWLEQFDQHCGNCITNMDVPIIATHQYNLNAQGVVDSLKQIHARWPNHKLWVTELAPATHALNNCPLSNEQVGDWMETVVRGAAALDYVERIYWNSGEWVSSLFIFSFEWIGKRN